MKTHRLAAMMIVVLSLTFCLSSKAQAGGEGFSESGFRVGPSKGQVVGAFAGGAAAVGVIAYLAVHYAKKHAITGCVVSQGSEMTLTDEGDHNTYLLSGETAAVTPGIRMKLAGKKIRPKDQNGPMGWRATKIRKSYGACPSHG